VLRYRHQADLIGHRTARGKFARFLVGESFSGVVLEHFWPLGRAPVIGVHSPQGVFCRTPVER